MLVENYSSWCMSGLRSIWEILQLISISLKLIRTIHLPWSVVSAVTEKVGRLVGHTFRCPLCWCLWTVTERPWTTGRHIVFWKLRPTAFRFWCPVYFLGGWRGGFHGKMICLEWSNMPYNIALYFHWTPLLTPTHKQFRTKSDAFPGACS